MKKLLGTGDVKMLTVNSHCKGAWIPPSEMKSVMGLVGDITYVLYTVYRAFPFKESSQLEDVYVADLLSWNPQKVQKNRLLLEKANLLHIVRYGTKLDGVTKVFVGLETVALHNAGLPADILDSQAFNKLKALMGIKNTADLINKANDMVLTYEANPDKYK